jgi:hypothetical protein
MSDQNEKKYKQLALFSVIVAEVVVTPSVLGGLVYWLMRGNNFQIVYTMIGAVLGLVVAFYRIYQVYKIQNKD